MNDTMIQEAVLDSIESIDDTQLYAECEVLVAMCDTYTKAFQIQQESADLKFDGYSVYQEADDSDADDADDDSEDGEKKKSGSVKKKLSAVGEKLGSMPKRFLEFIKKTARAIANFLQRKIGALVIKNMTVLNENTETKKAIKDAGCKIKRANGASTILWPCVDYEAVSNIIDEKMAGASDETHQNYATFHRMLAEVRAAAEKKAWSAEPFAGSRKCIKAMREIEKECGRQLSKTEHVMGTLRKEGKVDENYKATADQADKLKKAAAEASELLKIVTDGTNQTLEAYIRLKKILKEREIDEKAGKIDDDQYDKEKFPGGRRTNF